MKKKVLSKKYNYLIPIKINGNRRFGSQRDGGYVFHEKTFNKCNFFLSLGLGSHYSGWSLEYNFLKINKNIKIHIYDNTVNHLNYIKNILKCIKRFIKLRYSFKILKESFVQYFKYCSLIKIDRLKHFKKKVCNPSTYDDEINLLEIFNNIENDKRVFLKSDIESYEYEIIDQIINLSNRIEMMVIEFHEINKNELKFEKAIKMLKEKFEIIHLHANNYTGTFNEGMPITLEISFLRKTNIDFSSLEFIYEFPLPELDFPNNPYKEDIFFSFKN